MRASWGELPACARLIETPDTQLAAEGWDALSRNE
jgi:hypothetical protein